MASRSIGLFSLRLLEIARTTAEPTFDLIFTEYNRLYDQVSFERFSGYVVEAFEAGYIELGGGVVKGVDDVSRAIRLDQTIDAAVTNRRKSKVLTTYWSGIQPASIVKGIDRLKDDLGVDLMRNANRDLFDALIRNQVYMLRVGENVRREVIALLNKTEADLVAKIKARLSVKDGRSLLGTKRLQLIEQSLRSMRLEAWDQVTDYWIESMVDIARGQVATTAGIIKTTSPAVLDLSVPNAASIRAIVSTNPFEGRTLKKWADTIRDQDIQRMLDQVRIGLAQGETSDQIARRIVGSARLKGVDGTTEITRRNAAAITRTAINAVGSMARELLYEENADILDRERFVATLDARTTPICRSLDGKVFERGKGPRPPLHFNCRSLRVPFFDPEAIGSRPARSFTQKQMLREYAAAEGISPVSTRDRLPRGYKTAFDDFARRRMRELTSVIPGNETYQSWLGRQSAQFQDDVLGSTRAKLFRKGGLTLDKFVHRDGDLISLSDLARSHRDAFRAAGLDPEDFL